MLPDGSDGMGALARSRRLPPRGRRPRMPSRASGVLKTFAQRQEIGTAETARPLLGPRLPPCTWFHDSQSKSLFDAHVGADALVCPVERSSAALPVWQLACGVRLLIFRIPRLRRERGPVLLSPHIGRLGHHGQSVPQQLPGLPFPRSQSPAPAGKF